MKDFKNLATKSRKTDQASGKYANAGSSSNGILSLTKENIEALNENVQGLNEQPKVEADTDAILDATEHYDQAHCTQGNAGKSSNNFMTSIKQKLDKAKKPKSAGRPRPEAQPAPQSFNSTTVSSSSTSSAVSWPESVLDPFVSWEDIPQWNWSTTQCWDWLTLYCMDGLAIPEDEATRIAASYRGNGTTMYSLSHLYWVNIMGDHMRGTSILNRLTTVIQEDGAVAKTVIIV